MNYPHPLLAREGWPFIAGALLLAILTWVFAGFGWSLPLVTNRGNILVFMVAELPPMEKGKGEKILAIPGPKVAKREEYLAGIAVFKEGQRLMLRTGKGELLLRSGNDIDQYVSERALRGSKLPRGHQEVKEIEVQEK